MKIKRRELEQLHNAIRDCGNIQGEKFSYMLEKNLAKIMPELKQIGKFEESIRPEVTDKLKEYSRSNVMLSKDLRDGKINDVEYITKQQALREAYPDEAKLGDEFDAKLFPYLEEDVDVDFHTISREDLPNTITLNLRTGIKYFIKE